MNNELIDKKSSWQRYKNWILSFMILVAAALILFDITGATENAADMIKVYNEPSLYQNALAKANESLVVTEKMGTLEPIDEMAVMEGNAIYSNNDNSVELTLRVNGTKTGGKMDISADKINGKWVYKMIKIRIKSPEETLDIIGK